ncbi:MAG TPA: hypothetical protein VLC30_12640, partial [Pseudomonas sp.]|nr:hypothetical protein [Pseudomonas sp.]
QGREEAAAAEEERRLRNEQSKQDEQEAAQNEAPQPGSAAPGLDLYRNLGQLQEPASAVDLLA